MQGISHGINSGDIEYPMEYIDWVDSILTDIFDIGDVPWERWGYRGYPMRQEGYIGDIHRAKPLEHVCVKYRNQRRFGCREMNSFGI